MPFYYEKNCFKKPPQFNVRKVPKICSLVIPKTQNQFSVEGLHPLKKKNPKFYVRKVPKICSLVISKTRNPFSVEGLRHPEPLPPTGRCHGPQTPPPYFVPILYSISSYATDDIVL